MRCCVSFAPILDCLVLEDVVLDRRDLPPAWIDSFSRHGRVSGRCVEHRLHAAVNEALRGLTSQLAQTLASDDGALLLARMQRLSLARGARAGAGEAGPWTAPRHLGADRGRRRFT
jgi:hypothetical protein